MDSYLILLIGPSGVGKGTITSRLVDSFEALEKIPSYTTRVIRDQETDQKDYHFVDSKTFKAMDAEGKFLMTYLYEANMQWYGTSRELVYTALESGKSVIDETDARSIIALRRREPRLRENILTILILPPSMGSIKKRLEERDDLSAQEMQKRIGIDTTETQFCMKNQNHFDLVITNDDIEQSVEKIKAFLVESGVK